MLGANILPYRVDYDENKPFCMTVGGPLLFRLKSVDMVEGIAGLLKRVLGACFPDQKYETFHEGAKNEARVSCFSWALKFS